MASPTLHYPRGMRLRAAVSKLFSGLEYTSRRGLTRGMRRRGGLGWIPSDHLSVEERWFSQQEFHSEIVYDVGSFHGLMALHFARTAARVYAFEPVPAHQRIIRRNAELNSLERRIAVIPYGASDHDGRSKLAVDPLRPGTASADPEIAETIHGERFEIELRAIDGLGLPAPNFVKLDVEGMELPALRGMERTLRAHHPRLAIEIHGVDLLSKRANAEAVIAFLRSVGYLNVRWLETEVNAFDLWERAEGHLIAR